MSAFHALVLNLHQPEGNLEELMAQEPWSMREILYAIDRIPRSLWGYEDVGRVQLALSGTLLRTLSTPSFQAQTYGTVKCGDLLWYLQNTALVRVLGTAFYHPVLPLIPARDWEEQLSRFVDLGAWLFPGQLAGFWPPELGFCMELIPVLKRFGYRYVIVDSEHVEPLEEMSWPELRYRPHLARYGGEEITVVVRDRSLSDAQLSGMDLAWFLDEVAARTRHADFPALVTTCTDGDNGGWFRNVADSANFWGAFYRPLLDRVRADPAAVRPIFIDEYLDRYGAHGRVHVRTGAWNTGWHHGSDFKQWTGSGAQRDALERLRRVSRTLHETDQYCGSRRSGDSAVSALEHARSRLLRAQTSCHFFWGEAWVARCHADLDAAEAALSALGPG